MAFEFIKDMSTGWKFFWLIFGIFVVVVLIVTGISYGYWFGVCKCNIKKFPNCTDENTCDMNDWKYKTAFWISIIGTLIILSPCILAVIVSYNNYRPTRGLSI